MILSFLKNIPVKDHAKLLLSIAARVRDRRCCCDKLGFLERACGELPCQRRVQLWVPRVNAVDCVIIALVDPFQRRHRWCSTMCGRRLWLFKHAASEHGTRLRATYRIVGRADLGDEAPGDCHGARGDAETTLLQDQLSGITSCKIGGLTGDSLSFPLFEHSLPFLNK